MLRTVRRLSLEPCEDRTLPAGLAPAAHPPLDTVAHSSRPDPGAESDDDSEYATARPGSTVTARPAEGTPVLVPEFVVVAYPAIPPMPTRQTAPAMGAVAPPGPVAAVPALPAVAQFGPAPTPATPTPPPASVPAPTSAPPPDDGNDGPVELRPGAQGGTGEQRAVPDTEFPPVDAIVPAQLVIRDLDLRVTLSGLSATAGRLLDGLDAVGDALDAESPWMRLGYWVLAVGTVGVTVELTRQGLRARQPEPAQGPSLPETR